MEVFQWLEAKENATFLLALIGAVNGTLGLMISYLNRKDAIGQIEREQAQAAPWASLDIEEGDHAACMVRVAFFNPNETAFVVTQIEVETPQGRQVIQMHPNPLDLLGPPVPDTRRGGAKVPVNWTVRGGTPERAAFQEAFIVAEPRWNPETRDRWRAASKMRETTIGLRFRGHRLSAAQEAIDLRVKARN